MWLTNKIKQTKSFGNENVPPETPKNKKHYPTIKSEPKELLLKKNTMQSIDDDLFLFNTTPIFKLPQDCILIIFSLFSDVKTLTLLSSVCKLWKRFTSHPFLVIESTYPLL